MPLIEHKNPLGLLDGTVAVTQSVGDSSTKVATTAFVGNYTLANYQPLDATLTALAALDTTTGIVIQTGTDTFTKRTITGTTDRISVTNGTGVSGNPTIDIGSQVVNYTNLHASATTSTSQTTTATFVTIGSMSIANVPAGTYLLYFSGAVNNSNNNGVTVVSPHIAGTQVTGVGMRQANGGSHFSNANTRIPISLNAIPITVTATSTVDMRWTVSAGTTTMYERYFTLVKVG